MEIAGLPVKDLMKKIKIVITKDDCKKGATKDPGACAAALACMRQVGGCTAARIHISRTYLKVGDKWVRCQTPAALRSEIIAFDRGGTFEPGEYELRPLTPSDRARIGRRQGSDAKGARDKGSKDRTPSRSRMKPHMVTGVRQHGANR